MLLGTNSCALWSFDLLFQRFYLNKFELPSAGRLNAFFIFIHKYMSHYVGVIRYPIDFIWGRNLAFHCYMPNIKEFRSVVQENNIFQYFPNLYNLTCTRPLVSTTPSPLFYRMWMFYSTKNGRYLPLVSQEEVVYRKITDRCLPEKWLNILHPGIISVTTVEWKLFHDEVVQLYRKVR